MSVSTNGRVNLMKSRFERLHILEQADEQKRPLFQRSATCIDLTSKNNIDKNKISCILKNKKEILNISKRTDDKTLAVQASPRKRTNLDTSKRGSIKRSPAFRTIGTENAPRLFSTTPLESKAIAEIVTKTVNPAIQLTDTLKKALKQPLPNGPPPQKPPRTFNSPIKEVDIVAELAEIENQNCKLKIEEKLDISKKEAEPNTQAPSILNCISCFSAPVYDMTIRIPNKLFNQQKIPIAEIVEKQMNILNFDKLQNNNYNEHIYMEPFNQINGNIATLPDNSPEISKCQQSHSNGTDMHYMCTNLSTFENDQRKAVAKDESNINNTYDEINILLDVAYLEETQRNNESQNKSSTKTNPCHTSLARALTERRKNYIHHSQQTNNEKNIAQQYGTLHREQMSNKMLLSIDDDTRTAKDLINKYNKLSKSVSNQAITNEKSDIINVSRKCSQNQRLLEICLLVGYNVGTKQPYIKSKYPPNETAPANVEFIVFPCKSMVDVTAENQEYSIILTDDNKRIYGYCRRVVPEHSEYCLPLAYCLISEINAPGFFFKLLREIERRHGQPESHSNNIFQQLLNSELPDYGKSLHIKLLQQSKPKQILNTKALSYRRLSLETTPKWLTESASQQMDENFKEMGNSEKIFRKSIKTISMNKGTENEEIIISRPSDVRLECTQINDLFQSIGAELLLHIFETLLLERTVILYSKNISLLSSCVLGLQSLLYPFQWQYVWITVLPESLQEITEAPVPVLAGTMTEIQQDIEEGIFVDLEQKCIRQKNKEDFFSILPDCLSKSLRISLDMVNLLDQGKNLSSVLISEAFLRFFVELFGKLDVVNFQKENFIKLQEKSSIKLFLEVFLETYMFKDFVLSKQEKQKIKYFQLFDTKVMEKSENRTSFNRNQGIEIIMKNCKIINKKDKKSFATRLKEFFNVN